MHNLITVTRLALAVFLNVGAVIMLAWFHYVHGDAPAGVAVALGLAACAAIVAPSMVDVHTLTHALHEANKQNG